eukprot:g24523.t1
MGLCEWQQVLALLKQMRKLSISAPRCMSVTLGALATACEKGQQWKAALQLKHSAPVINVAAWPKQQQLHALGLT